ncbi:MAG: hypothetical protein PHD72_01965 [Patescibacteria group bacterium]|nr:hypothetical protein [Patescibacteria group bacterium]
MPGQQHQPKKKTAPWSGADFFSTKLREELHVLSHESLLKLDSHRSQESFLGEERDKLYQRIRLRHQLYRSLLEKNMLRILGALSGLVNCG